ncbi:precorrin-6Y C5,15-methyltransferase (decarboxylating) subunit CbiT [Halanaerobium salsuginis]|jgi:precorrin-6Y C5,15-methyltransferase (decarboxylating) CbiT subunit|uniref:Cobalt-precorrin 7 C15-methyltransferase n=1 Tax=Halanaerobium salsuginis TaxID=29563 RepID=A0A1I4K5D8_9FIRM|nr:precorrin-6Y C5,15-methyltransferase (decarboxylating) subunit CbiT [Halanaerobium salsuginis]SFL73837.1 cobalt-precorrin 7 C15-methyltransferase [Halanaerobium salsuginis]
MTSWNYNTPGIEDQFFYRDQVPMTKSEIRALIISKLKLKSGQIIYDIGAGSGSVSIETALQVKDGLVYAVEKEKQACQVIEKNIERFKVNNIKLIQGTAPEALNTLEAADRIFIGGSSGKLAEILTLSLKKLKAGGIILLSAITLNTLTEVASYFNNGSEEVEVWSININYTQKIKDYKLFKALNQIFLIRITEGG